MNTTSQPRHLNVQQERNLHYQIYGFYFVYVLYKKATAHVGTKSLNMRYQSQNGFCGIIVGIPQHQKGYLVYVPHKRKIISSYNVVFNESFY